MKVAEALTREEWTKLLKREPVKRATGVKPALVETPAEVVARLSRGN